MTTRTTHLSVVIIAMAVACAAPKAAPVAPAAIPDDAAVTETVVGVAHHIDARDWTSLRALYADEVETDYTSLFGGEVQRQPGDALIGAWTQLLTPLTTQHLLGPIDVSVSGDTATARCHVRGYHFAEKAPSGSTWMVAGHYIFTLRKSGDRWRITHMKLDTYYQTGNTKLLAEAAANR